MYTHVLLQGSQGVVFSAFPNSNLTPKYTNMPNFLPVFEGMKLLYCIIRSPSPRGL